MGIKSGNKRGRVYRIRDSIANMIGILNHANQMNPINHGSDKCSKQINNEDSYSD